MRARLARARERANADPDRRRYFRAAAIGGGAAGVVHAVMLSITGGMFTPSLFSGFYEVQARAFRHGRWNIPPGSLGIEAFVIDGKSYEYYGPWPAVLRMPLMALFPGMDGRWTQLFMLLALGIALTAATRIGWLVRGLVRSGADPTVSRTEAIWVGVFTFGLGAGSVLLFLTSHAWVYHEAEIWGASLSLAAFAAIVELLVTQRLRLLAFASLFATLSICSRASVGFGPIAALLAIGGASLFASTRRWFGVPEALATWGTRVRFGLAAGVPIVTYMYVNYSKFGSLFVFPSDKQIFSQVGVYRQEMLRQNDNSLFGFKFFATAARQYLRPDALQLRRLPPFVDFPRTASVIGDDVLFDTIEPTSSVPSSMPVLTILAIVGVVVLVRRRRRAADGADLETSAAPEASGSVAPLRLVVLGALAGAWTVVPYSYIGQRYMSDFVPPLVVLSAIGLAWLVVVAQRTDRRRVAFGAGLATLVLFASWVNAGLAYSYHYETELVPEGPLTPYVEWQYEWHDRFGIGDPPYVERGDTLPDPPSARGTTFVLGDCDGVYWSQGNTWEPSAKWYALARTEATGRYDLRLRFDQPESPVVLPVLVRGEAGAVQAIAVQVRRTNVRFGWYDEVHPAPPDTPDDGRDASGIIWGPRLQYDPDDTVAVEIVTDPNNGKISVVMDGYPAFVFYDYGLTTPELARYVTPTDRVRIGTNDVGAPMADEFAGDIRRREQPRPEICDRLD